MLRNDIAPTLSLDGTWDFALGSDASWQTIEVPGCWEAHGHDVQIDGPAHYRRDIFVPVAWMGQRVVLEFDAVSYSCIVRVNDREVGRHLGMWTPFAFDITDALQIGHRNHIALEIYKPGTRYPVRTTLAGFLPDVATTFGGVWQRARLRATTVGIDDLLVDADPTTGTLRVRCNVSAFADLTGTTVSVMAFHEGERVADASIACAEGGLQEVMLTVPNPVPWSPASPALYGVQVQLVQDGVVLAEARERVGFRKLVAEGEGLLLNDEPVLLRGVLSWGWDPTRIAPLFDREQVRDEIRRVRELGFNLIKLCLFVPNSVYYDVADEEGMLLWQEWPIWLPQITPELRAQAPAEYAAYMRLTRHHPSVAVYSVGCEMNASVDAGLLGQLDAIVRGEAAGTLVCDNSGSGEAYGGLPFDLADFADYHTYAEVHHFEPLLDNWRRGWQPPRPWIFGEFCDSDGYRDIDALVAANNGTKPWWMTDAIPVQSWRPEVVALIEQQERIAHAQPGFATHELITIANAQSLMVRKFWLEALRRRPETGGYVITGLRDTPIASSGIFDDFGQPKFSAADFRAFNGDAVLSIDSGRRRRWLHDGERVEPIDRHNWWAGNPLRLHLILSHVSPAPVSGTAIWRLATLDGVEVASGQSDVRHPVPPSQPREVAVIECVLPAVNQAQELRLEARVVGGVETVNSWPIWVFPQPTTWPGALALYDPSFVLDSLEMADHVRRVELGSGATPALVIASALGPTLLDYLCNGGRVLFVQTGNGPLPVRRAPFWREALKLFPDHPLWGVFPTRGYADLQFFGLATDAALDAARLPGVIHDITNIRPIMRRLDARHFHINEYILEAQVGAGRLLATTLQLGGGSGAQPWGPRRHVAGHFMLWALLQHLAR